MSLTPRTSVVLVDDHAVVLSGMRQVVNDTPDFTVLDTYSDAVTALPGVRNLQPDLVILDLRLGSQLGPEVCRSILRESPSSRVIILTGFAEVPLLRACLHEGASGILLKSSSESDILASMRRVMQGEVVLDPEVARELGPWPAAAMIDSDGVVIAELRASEYRVLRLLAQGLTTVEIQTELGLAHNTVRSYIQSLMEKLGARSRVQVVVKAQALKLL